VSNSLKKRLITLKCRINRKKTQVDTITLDDVHLNQGWIIG